MYNNVVVLYGITLET